MEAKELMLNDKVYICLDNGKKVKCEVKGLSGNRVFFEPLEEAELYGNEDSEEYFEPIPPTEEILKKNGFEWNGCFWVLNSPKYHHNILMRYIDEDTLEPIPNLYINHWVLDESYIIDNVHELQHALRLCGLTELANNFKV